MIELVDHMGDDLRVANVARVSFNNWKEELDNKDVKLIHYLANHEHNSPFRHTSITVRCTTPIFLARQLGKHQVGMSWNEVSRRYVDTNIEYHIPDKWRNRPHKSIKQGSGDDLQGRKQLEARRTYLFAIEVAQRAYDYLLELNVAPEQARMVLPQSMQTTWIWTGSLESFYHVWRLRSGNGAQEEAMEFAAQLEKIIQPIFPHCWEALSGGQCEV